MKMNDPFLASFLKSIDSNQLSDAQISFLGQLLSLKNAKENPLINQTNQGGYWENHLHRHAGAYVSEREELLQAMNLLIRANQKDQDKERAVKKLLLDLNPNQPIPGFSQAKPTNLENPLVGQIFHLARQANLSRDYPNLAQMIEAEIALRPIRKQLLNYLGASAACFLSLKIEPIKAQKIWALAQWSNSLII